MHISEVEKHRLEKEHHMRNGYAIHDNNRFPHDNPVQEHAHIFKDNENKHARETVPSDYEQNMEMGQ